MRVLSPRSKTSRVNTKRLQMKKIPWWKELTANFRNDAISKPMELLLTISTIVLAVFTVALWWATNGLLNSDREKSVQQAKDTQESLEFTRKMVDAVLVQANAMNDGNSIARRSMREANLPSLTIRIYNSNQFEINNPYQIVPTISNNGNSVAYDVKGLFQLRTSMPRTIDEMKQERVSGGSQGILGKGEAVTYPSTIDAKFINGEFIADIENGKIVITMTGRVDYRDVFKKHHAIMFCSYYDRILKNFTYCAIGNYIIE
jgi:hypothetical protein